MNDAQLAACLEVPLKTEVSNNTQSIKVDSKVDDGLDCRCSLACQTVRTTVL